MSEFGRSLSGNEVQPMQTVTNNAASQSMKGDRDTMRVIVVLDKDEPLSFVFVHEHLRRLPAELFVLRGREPGRYEPSGKRSYPMTVGGPPLRPKTIFTALRHRLLGVRFPKLPQAVERAWEEYLGQQKPDVVLAEFAPQALACLPACARHGIPLVTHFHGYDASSLLRFRDYRRQLPDLFEHSAVVVVVSTDMRERLRRYGYPMEKRN